MNGPCVEYLKVDYVTMKPRYFTDVGRRSPISNAAPLLKLNN